jgi:hypothetical protein
MAERKVYEHERLKRALASPTLPNMDLQDPQGIAFAYRFNQSDEIHDNLRRLLFSDPARAAIIARPSSYFDFQGVDISATQPPPSVDDTFRIATFIVGTGANGEIISIDLTNVHKSPFFRIIDFDPLQVVQYGTNENHIIAALVQSVRKTMSLIPIQNARVMISFDTYFNRSQAQAGGWHQDADYGSTMTRLDPHVVTLEYFCANRMLGPELMLLDTPPQLLPDAASLNAVSQNFQHSCRFIVGDKSVAFFYNTRVIHATPMASVLRPDPLTGEFYKITPALLPPDRRVMALDPGRAENINSGFNPLAAATLSQLRSFLRSHLVILNDEQYGQLQEQIPNTRYMQPLFEHPTIDPAGPPVTRPDFEVHSRAPPPTPQGQAAAAEPPASTGALYSMESPFFGGAPPLRNFFIQSKYLYVNEYVPLTPLNEKNIKKFQEKEEIFIANFETISNELDIKKLNGGKTRKSKKRRLQRKRLSKRNKN